MKILVIGSGGREHALVWKLAFAVIGAAIFFFPPAAAFAGEPNPPDILEHLRREHPRLLLTAKDWEMLRAGRTNDSKMAPVLDRAVAKARGLLAAPPLAYKKDGKRLLAVSREALRRIALCSFACRLTGEKVFLERAQQDMLAAAAFSDWNPSHFLDTAEMTAALAIGYDWLNDALPATTRATVRQAILEKGIKPGLNPTDSWNWWQKRDINWNQVCYGGLTLGALAIADENPEVARELLESARTNNVNGLKPYAPDGVYPEGPGYWDYGTTYQVLMLQALETALGTDWNLSARPGFLASAAALVQQTGPTGRPFNFSDGRDSEAFNPALFWFARKLHQPELVYFQDQFLRRELTASPADDKRDRLFPFLLFWIGGLPEEIPPPTLPLAWHGDGPNPVGVFRSSWTDSNALFLAFKGGSAGVSHAHMDAGAFVLDADGVRWASDLGSQDYLSIESKGWALFKMTQDSDRWRVFRLNNFSHNTLTLGGKLHNMAGDARITTFTANSATVNLSPIFAGQAGSVMRHFSVGENRGVVIRDEISDAKPGLSVRWQMVTRATIEVDGERAVLRQGDKSLRATIIIPAGARFEIASAQPPDDGVNQANPNSRILAVNSLVPDSGKLTIEIKLQADSAPVVR